jgi:hypothetical protein
MKVCKCCKELKDESEFYKHSKKLDGLFNECKSCLSEYSRNKYIREKDTILARNKVYRENNKAEMYAQQRVWSKANPDKLKVYNAKHRCNDPVKKAAWRSKRRASKLNRTPPWLSKEELNKIREVYKLARKLSKETGVLHHVDHIIPLQGKLASGLHTLNNLQVLTAKDNLVKSNKII